MYVIKLLVQVLLAIYYCTTELIHNNKDFGPTKLDGQSQNYIYSFFKESLESLLIS